MQAYKWGYLSDLQSTSCLLPKVRVNVHGHHRSRPLDSTVQVAIPVSMQPSRSLLSRGARRINCRTSSRAFSLATARERGAHVDLHPEVEDALNAGRPVVALETAVITHGFPAPRCLELGRDLEGLVRAGGAVPATIGFVGGRVKIGLTSPELERLAYRMENPAKVSRRDVAAAITAGADGGALIE